MPRTTSKKSASNNSKESATENALDQLRTGMPSLDSIDEQITLKSPVGSGREFRILRTFEIDSYEVSQPIEGLAVRPASRTPAFAPPPVPQGDNFKGKARKAAKISIADAPIRKYKDLKNLIKTLTPDKDMVNHVPKIKTTSTSDRVEEEKRNIRVKAFLYAASKENDNDYHLIIGRDPNLTPEIYMNMELSGLPPATSPHFAKLKEARDSFKNYFGNKLPGTSYDFYDPPIPVLIEGSLFFDMSHATGQQPGPQSLKSRIPTIWEVHPITKIVFEP